MIMLDSSFLIAYHNTKDKNHKQASELMPRIASGVYGKVNITDYIFDETATYLAAKQGLGKAVTVGTYLLGASELIGVTKNDFDDAWRLFKSQRNTRLSFTDCTIIIAMRANSITKLATFDGDFEKFSDLSVVS
jgi:predicted nucleic acid-binding protein